MGRDLTPEEREEFERRRREQIERNCKLLGISVEAHERIYRKALKKEQEPDEKKRAERALFTALYQIGRGFLDGLKNQNYRDALDTVDDVNRLSDFEFTTLLARRMSVLDEEERDAAREIISRRIDKWGEGEALSLREVILLDLQSIIRAHYNREKR